MAVAVLRWCWRSPTPPAWVVRVRGGRSPSPTGNVGIRDGWKVGEVGVVVVAAALAAAEQAASGGVVAGDASGAVTRDPGAVVVAVGEAAGEGHAGVTADAPLNIDGPTLIQGCVESVVGGVE